MLKVPKHPRIPGTSRIFCLFTEFVLVFLRCVLILCFTVLVLVTVAATQYCQISEQIRKKYKSQSGASISYVSSFYLRVILVGYRKAQQGDCDRK